MKRFILILSALAVGAFAAMPAMASAAPGAVTVVTHSAQHLDTTSVSGPATLPSDGGPVWALDNLSERYTVTPTNVAGQWLVAIETQGSFQGFASPFDGTADVNNGSVKGTISYLVQSSTAPDKNLVPAQEPDGSSIRLPITQMFPNGFISGGGDHYTFTYNQVDGAEYVQTA